MFYTLFGDCMERQILHIDVNNAFLSWTALELLKEGATEDIRKIPSAICGDEQKRTGIILAKSMLAKSFGVVTGETIYQAQRKCPNLKLYSSRYDAYKRYSDALYNLLSEYTYMIERFSVDECFLDMTTFLMGDTLLAKANEISKRVKNELGFTVNIGLSNNKMLAKMASDFAKPDRIHTLYPHEIEEKIWPMDVSELFMVGRKSAEKLYKFGIHTIGDLANFDKKFIERKFGKQGTMMWEYANGIDESEVVYKYEKSKSIGNSITLPMDVDNKEKIESILLALVEQVTFRLRKEDRLATVAAVQLRSNAFKDYLHQSKLEFATSNTDTIYKVAKRILSEMYTTQYPVRLVGFRVDGLVDTEDSQTSLFNTNTPKNDALDKTVDKLKEKFGYGAITKAGDMNVNKYMKFK